jgi:hypothetical protein
MSIFDTIRNAIFRRGGHGQAQAGAATAGGAQAQSGGQAQGTLNRGPAGATGASAGPVAAPRPASTPQPSAPAAQAAPAPPVDVEAVLDGLARDQGQQLNWRTSIVDLMKLLALDSSLANRKQLAHELGYTGNENDSATMNVWLHRQVMRKLAENGGHVPADLKD